MTLVPMFSGSSSGASGDSDMVDRRGMAILEKCSGSLFSTFRHAPHPKFRPIPQATENGCKKPKCRDWHVKRYGTLPPKQSQPLDAFGSGSASPQQTKIGDLDHIRLIRVMSQSPTLHLYPLPYTALNPPSELARDVEIASERSNTLAFSTGLDNRDTFFGRRRCVVCGNSTPSILQRCHIIGRTDVSAVRPIVQLNLHLRPLSFFYYNTVGFARAIGMGSWWC